MDLKPISKDYLAQVIRDYEYYSLYQKKNRTVIDTPENYEACTSSDSGALLIIDDSSATAGANEVGLSVVEAFITDGSVSAGDYVKHIEEVNHVEQYYDKIYATTDNTYTKTEVNILLTNVISGEIGDLYVKVDNEDYLRLYENEHTHTSYTNDEIDAWFDASTEELAYYSSIINDALTSVNRLWSSKQISDEIAKAILESNAYADGLISNISSISLKYVDTLPTTGEASTVYILKPTTASDKLTLNLYNSAWITIGDFEISLDDYYTKTEIDTTLADYAKKTEVLGVDALVTDISAPNNTTVLSTTGLKTELDKKLDADDITDLIDDTASATDKVYSSNKVDDLIGAIIDDTASSEDSTYSSKKIDGFVSDKADVSYVADNWQGNSYNLIPYPYYEGLSKSLNGIDFVVNEDGSILINGTNTSSGDNTFQIIGCWTKVNGFELQDGKKYTFVEPCANTSTTTHYMQAVICDDVPAAKSYLSFGKTIQKSDTYRYLGLRIVVKAGVTVDNVLYKPMLVEIAEDGTYPTVYQRNAKSNVQLTDKIKDKLSESDSAINWNGNGYNISPFPYYNNDGFVYKSVTFNYKNDGIVKTSGTATEESYFRMLSNSTDFISKLEVGKKYRISGCPSGGSTSTYMVNFYINDGSANIVSVADVGNGIIFEMPDGGQTASFGIRIKANVDSTGLEFKPMITEVAEDGSYPTEYQRSAKGNVELNDELDETNRKLLKNYYNIYSYKENNGTSITCVKNDDESITVNTILDSSNKFSNTSPIMNGEPIDLYDLKGKKLYLWLELVSGTISQNWFGLVVAKKANDGSSINNDYPYVSDASIGNKLIKVYDVNELIEAGVRYIVMAPWCSNNNKYTDAVLKITVLDEPIRIEHHIKYTNDITENKRKALDVKMLGWSVPKGMLTRNYVDASGIYHQRVGRVDCGTLTWISHENGYYTEYIKNISKTSSRVYIIKYPYSNIITWQPGSITHVPNGNVLIGDDSFSDMDAFMTAMSGVYLYYELATEITKTDGNEINAELLNYTKLNSTFGDVVGGYSKIGRQVLVNFTLTLTSQLSSGLNVLVNNLPTSITYGFGTGLCSSNRSYKITTCYCESGKITVDVPQDIPSGQNISVDLMYISNS